MKFVARPTTTHSPALYCGYASLGLLPHSLTLQLHILSPYTAAMHHVAYYHILSPYNHTFSRPILQLCIPRPISAFCRPIPTYFLAL